MLQSQAYPSKKKWIILAIFLVAVLLGATGYGLSQSILFTPRLTANQNIGTIHSGMTPAQVIAAIGQPHHIEMRGTPDELWAYYPDDGMFSSWMMPYYISFDKRGNVKNIWN